MWKSASTFSFWAWIYLLCYGVFVWLLLLLFCHLCSEKFSWKHLAPQTGNGIESCSSCLGFRKLSVHLVEGGVWVFACHKLNSQNLSQKMLCYPRPHCCCFISTWILANDRYQINHFVIWLFENFTEWSRGEWFAPLNTKLVATLTSIWRKYLMRISM